MNMSKQSNALVKFIGTIGSTVSGAAIGLLIGLADAGGISNMMALPPAITGLSLCWYFAVLGLGAGIFNSLTFSETSGYRRNYCVLGFASTFALGLLMGWHPATLPGFAAFAPSLILMSLLGAFLGYSFYLAARLVRSDLTPEW